MTWTERFVVGLLLVATYGLHFSPPDMTDWATQPSKNPTAENNEGQPEPIQKLDFSPLDGLVFLEKIRASHGLR